MRAIAANPNRTGTKITIQVGLSMQLDSISQKAIPANFLQHPFLHNSFSAYEQVSDIYLLMF